jgi:MYXO-CTERM domain-containing protein
VATAGDDFTATSIEAGQVDSGESPNTVTFTGTIFGGGTVNQQYSDPGHSTALVTVNLTGFSNITNLKIQQGPNTFQDLTITTPGPATPEPGTLWLGAGALALLPVIRKYRRQGFLQVR